jgi:hypothetical protein
LQASSISIFFSVSQNSAIKLRVNKTIWLKDAQNRKKQLSSTSLVVYEKFKQETIFKIPVKKNTGLVLKRMYNQ